MEQKQKISNGMKIFITGVSSGIGKALFKKLIKQGHHVWGIAKDNLPDDLKNNLIPDKFFYSVCDISKEENVLNVASDMERVNFLPDVVVLNAGIEKKDLLEGYKNKIAKDVFDVNFFGALICVEIFINKFFKRGSGKFIAISSLFAKRPDVDSASYCSSKSALSMAFRSFYLHYYKNNIIFTNIYFGPVDTNISSSYKKTGGKKPFFVISPERAAEGIIKAVKGKKSTYYFPFFIAIVIRLTSFLSDLIFLRITKFFRR